MANRALANCDWTAPPRPGTAHKHCAIGAAEGSFAVQQHLKITPAKGPIAFRASSRYWCGRFLIRGRCRVRASPNTREETCVS